ncbi:MAG: protein kinase [Planctomycetes bacterium]|nr:protein kinase [Planctomycetota bacterium]
MNEREIFIAALQKRTPAERSAYIDAVCDGDWDLAARVRSLLAEHENLGSFLESPVGDPGAGWALPLDECAETQIGPYKLLQPIGEGGMGVVYMAHQNEPVERRVALKLIKPGMDTRQVIGRFEAEQHALAMMDHPNIAKVLDAGATESGRPYFVMELVKGVPITRYCDEHSLTPKERLKLFLPVLHAIQHAHQKGIIHRDIKPSNVLVAEYDELPVPKVIDFGVAKATGRKLTEKTMFTQYGQLVGTLEYMSPEQAKLNQLDIDTRSDIYSLGAVHWIVMRAMDKDRSRRYETVNSFAADIQRYLANEPVQASPPSSAYRLRKFARRNKTAVIAAILVAAALVVGTAVSAWQAIEADAARELAGDRLALANERLASESIAYQEMETQRQRAEHNLAKANDAVEKYFTVVSGNRLLDVPGLEPLRKELLQSALDYYLVLLRDEGDDTQSQAEVAAAYFRVGQIEFAMDAPEAALTAFEAGLAITEKLRRDPNVTGDVLRRLAGLYTGERSQYRSTRPPPDPPRTRRLIERGIGIWEELSLRDPAAAGFRCDLAALYGELGELQAGLGDRNQAIDSLEKARELWRHLVHENPNAQDYRASLAHSCERAGLLSVTAGRIQDAAAAYRESLELTVQLVNDFPHVAHYRELLARSQSSLGNLVARTNPSEAEQALRQALDSHQQLSTEFPAVPLFREDSAISGFNLANLLSESGRPEQAATTLREAIVVLQRLAEDYPRQSDHWRRLARYHYGLGLILNRAGHDEDAKESYARAFTIRNRLVSEFPQVSRYWEELAWQLATCPDVESRDPRRAVALALQAVELSPQNGACSKMLGVAQYRVGDYDSALKSLQTSSSASFSRVCHWFLAMTHWQLGDQEEARKCYDQAVEWMDKNKPRDEELLRFRAEAEKLLGVSEQAALD